MALSYYSNFPCFMRETLGNTLGWWSNLKDDWDDSPAMHSPITMFKYSSTGTSLDRRVEVYLTSKKLQAVVLALIGYEESIDRIPENRIFFEFDKNQIVEANKLTHEEKFFLTCSPGIKISVVDLRPTPTLVEPPYQTEKFEKIVAIVFKVATERIESAMILPPILYSKELGNHLYKFEIGLDREKKFVAKVSFIGNQHLSILLPESRFFIKTNEEPRAYNDPDNRSSCVIYPIDRLYSTIEKKINFLDHQLQNHYFQSLEKSHGSNNQENPLSKLFGLIFIEKDRF